MKQLAALLISPGPIDGYPPVQNQARLLANAGYTVQVVTMPLPNHAVVTFEYTGVAVTPVPFTSGSGRQTIARTMRFIRAIASIRRRWRHRPFVEIAYDPLGMLYSDLAPLRPRFRVAHFHEGLPNFANAWIEKRLVRGVHNYQFVVVPDAGRGRIIAEKLRLRDDPILVPNYPLRSDLHRSARIYPPDAEFEVIYSGTIGATQQIDFIVKSVAHWPKGTVLSILGNDQVPFAEQLKSLITAGGLKGRVRFAGWVNTQALRARLCQAHLGIALLDGRRPQWSTALGASNKRYQYMQAGLAQIGDMNPGVPDLIEGNGIGQCLRSQSVEELSSIVRSYAENPKRCVDEGERALRLHLEKYNYEQVFSPLVDCISSQLATSNNASA